MRQITLTDIDISNLPKEADPLAVATEIYVAQCEYNDAKTKLEKVLYKYGLIEKLEGSDEETR